MQDKRNGGMEEREKFEGGKEGATKKEKSEQGKRKRLTLTEACGERKEGLIVAGHLHLLRSLKQTPPPHHPQRNLPGILPSPSLMCKERYHPRAE